MPTYTCSIQYEIDAETPEEAAHIAVDWSRDAWPVVEVTDGDGLSIYIDTEKEGDV